MQRRTAVILGVLVAVFAVAEVIVLSAVLAADRHADRERYVEAMASQRRAAGRPVPGQAGERPAPATAPVAFCVRGVDTLVTAVRDGLGRQVVGDRRRLDLAMLRSLSSLAIRAQRYAEQASGQPALPQRMGRVRVTDPGNGSDATPTWQALAPARIACDSGQAYAMFRLDLEDGTVAVPPAARPARPEPAAAKPGRAAPGKQRKPAPGRTSGRTGRRR